MGSPFASLRELAAFVTPAPPTGDPQAAWSNLTRSILESQAARAQAEQFDANQRNLGARHRADTDLNYAQLGETRRHAQAQEADWATQRDQTRRDAQSKVIASIREAAAKGAPPEVLNAMVAEAKRQGVDLVEQMEQPEAPPAQPLAAFAWPGAEVRELPQAPPPEPRPTGRFSVSAGGEDLGAIDVPAIRAGERRDFAPAAQAYVRGGRPQDRQARALAATTVGSLPGLSPQERFEAMNEEASDQLGRESSERNARQMSLRQDVRGASLNTARADSMAMRKAQTVAQRMGLQGVNESLRHADESIALMESGNPISQNDAFLAHLRLQQGSRPTDKDLVFQLRQGGLYTRLMNALENIDSGKFDPSYQGLFTEAARIHKRLLEQKRINIAKAARNSILSSPAIRGMVGPEVQMEYADEQAAAVLGGFVQPTGDPGGAGGGGGASSSVSARGDIVPGPEGLGEVLDIDQLEEVE